MTDRITNIIIAVMLFISFFFLVYVNADYKEIKQFYYPFVNRINELEEQARTNEHNNCYLYLLYLYPEEDLHSHYGECIGNGHYKLLPNE